MLAWLEDHPENTSLSPEAKRFLVRETLSARLRIGGRAETPVRAAECAAVSLREALLAGDASRFDAPLLEREEVSKCG